MLEKIVAKIEKRYPVTGAHEGDIPEILRVFNEVWPDRNNQSRFHQRFSYRYLRYPCSIGTAKIAVARDGPRIVGFVGSMDFELCYHKQTLPATCSIDQAVLPAYQSLGIGYLLLKHTYQRHVVAMAGDLNAAAYRLHKTMGIREISPCHILRRWTHLTDPLRRWDDRVFTVDHSAKIDDRFDALYLAARHDYPVMALRNRSVLTWRYQDHPLRQFTIHTLCRASELLGYAVTTMEPLARIGLKAILVDFLFTPISAPIITAFLSSVIGHLARYGALCVDTIATHPPTIHILHHIGFSYKPGSPHFVIYPNQMTQDKRDLWDGHNWHLTFGDSDFYLT